MTPRLFIQPRRMTWTEFQTPRGKRRAWRSLYLYDHGFLRKLYDNTHALSDQMWRTYQPSPQRLEDWAKLGVKTIINLRGTRDSDQQAGFYFLEKAAAQQHGMRLIDHRAYSRDAPSKDFIFFLDKNFKTIQYPAIMHCKSGADRVGLASVLFLFLHEEKPLDEALGHLTLKYGHIRHGKTGILDYFFETYKTYAENTKEHPTAMHFLKWVEDVYDPEALKEMYTPSPAGTVLVDFILRRE